MRYYEIKKAAIVEVYMQFVISFALCSIVDCYKYYFQHLQIAVAP